MLLICIREKGHHFEPTNRHIGLSSTFQNHPLVSLKMTLLSGVKIFHVKLILAFAFVNVDHVGQLA